MAQHGHFHWNELLTRDVEGAKAFYGKIAGWRFEGMSMPDGTYWVCKDGEQPVGGIMDINQPRFEGVPVQWFAYLAVDDVDARVKQATAAGAATDAPDLRCAGRRPHRDHQGPDRRGPGLDHAGEPVKSRRSKRPVELRPCKPFPSFQAFSAARRHEGDRQLRRGRAFARGKVPAVRAQRQERPAVVRPCR